MDCNYYCGEKISRENRDAIQFPGKSCENVHYLLFVVDTASSNMYPEVSSFEEVSASFFSSSGVSTPIARNVVSRFCSFFCCLALVVPVYAYTRYVHIFIYVHRAHTTCVYISREEMIHTRPAFHSRKFTYTYLVCYPYHLLPQRGFVPRSIWGLVPLGRMRKRRERRWNVGGAAGIP